MEFTPVGESPRDHVSLHGEQNHAQNDVQQKQAVHETLAMSTLSGAHDLSPVGSYSPQFSPQAQRILQLMRNCSDSQNTAIASQDPPADAQANRRPGIESPELNSYLYLADPPDSANFAINWVSATPVHQNSIGEDTKVPMIEDGVPVIRKDDLALEILFDAPPLMGEFDSRRLEQLHEFKDQIERCTECERVSWTGQNLLIRCHLCTLTYHQLCHEPEISNDPTINAYFTCSTCIAEQKLINRSSGRKGEKYVSPDIPGSAGVREGHLLAPPLRLVASESRLEQLVGYTSDSASLDLVCNY
jgi:hypothetical protein